MSEEEQVKQTYTVLLRTSDDDYVFMEDVRAKGPIEAVMELFDDIVIDEEGLYKGFAKHLFPIAVDGDETRYTPEDMMEMIDS